MNSSRRDFLTKSLAAGALAAVVQVTTANGATVLARSEVTSAAAAGLVVGVVSLPLSMAFAIASGVKPEQIGRAHV